MEFVLDSEYPHNITGNMTSPSTVERVAADTVAFVQRRQAAAPHAPTAAAERRHESPSRSAQRASGATGSPRAGGAGDIPSGITASWPR
jgi:hypothetical protein